MDNSAENNATEVEKAADRIDTLSAAQIKHKLRQSIQARASARAATLTRRQRRLQARRKREAHSRDDRALAQREAQGQGQCQGRGAQEDIVVDESLSTMQRKHATLLRRVEVYADKFRQWAWRAVEPLVADEEEFLMRVRFVMPEDDELVKQSFLSTLVVMFHGHVWCFVTDELGGIPEMVRREGGSLLCHPRDRIDVLRDHKFFTKRLDKGRHGMRVRIRASRVPFLKLPFWSSSWIPATFVLNGIADDASFRAAFPTSDARLALVRETCTRTAALLGKISEWRDESAQSVQRAQAVLDGVRDGKRASDVLLADVRERSGP